MTFVFVTTCMFKTSLLLNLTSAAVMLLAIPLIYYMKLLTHQFDADDERMKNTSQK